MAALHSITAYTPDLDCPKCEGGGLVCEDHPDTAWDLLHDTVCGAPGMPCDCIRWVCGAVGPHPEECPESKADFSARIERGEIREGDLERWRQNVADWINR